MTGAPRREISVMRARPKIAISGLTSAAVLRRDAATAPCMAHTASAVIASLPGSPRCQAGPGVALSGGILARLGFEATAEVAVGDDALAESLVAQLRSLSPNLLLLDRRLPGTATNEYTIRSPRDPAASLAIPHRPSAPSIPELPLGEGASRSVGVWCYPASLVWQDDGEEERLSGLMADYAEHGVTQVLELGLLDLDRPGGVRRNGGPWQEWLRPLLPFTDVLCVQGDDLLKLLDPESARSFSEQGTLHDIPMWLTGRILHEMSGFLLSCGLGVAVIGLREHGVYFRSNPNSDRVTFARKFAPDDQVASHLAMWTDRDMLIPLFECEHGNTYSATDALTAGIVAAIVGGMSPGDALRFAAAVVSFCLEAADPLSKIPLLDVVKARVDGGWTQAHCGLDLRGWSDE